MGKKKDQDKKDKSKKKKAPFELGGEIDVTLSKSGFLDALWKVGKPD